MHGAGDGLGVCVSKGEVLGLANRPDRPKLVLQGATSMGVEGGDRPSEGELRGGAMGARVAAFARFFVGVAAESPAPTAAGRFRTIDAIAAAAGRFMTTGRKKRARASPRRDNNCDNQWLRRQACGMRATTLRP